MALGETDKRLLALLEPIFADHAELIEALLPSRLRRNWRQAVAFARPAKGRKSLDHRELLLAMAAGDADPPHPPRELAARAIARLPVIEGAADDDHKHVEMPDGSRPARKDLIDRLGREYTAQRPELLAAIVAGEQITQRMLVMAEEVRRATPPRVANKRTAMELAKLRSLPPEALRPVAQAHQVDEVLKVFRSTRRRGPA